SDWWSDETMQLALVALLDAVSDAYAVDADRLYVTGLSMGGYGAWALAARQPHRFAALAPICGGGDPATATSFVHLPVWAFHGAQDNVVPVRRTQEMVEALRQAGAEARLTIYPDAGHDSWTETYENPKLYEWLLAQSRP
ncbi:MAG: prolyl oligopeptidase family serine peptidase, partial [Phycisphaerales bacterium JB038]